jgi:CobQ-like glutamine amidotransferase family enzyme
MNKEVVTIGTAVLAGAITRGATGMLLDTADNTVKMGVNFVGCAGFGFLATKVTGTDTKAAALRGSAIGSAVAHGLQLIGNIFSTETIAAKISAVDATTGTVSKFNNFLSKAAGLSCPAEGLAGYIDANGNYHEDGLAGYIDAQGNFIEDGLSASYDGSEDNQQLIGYEEYQAQNEGLQASIDADGNNII